MIPPKSRPEWRRLLLDSAQQDLSFLAFKLILMRLRMVLRKDSSDSNVRRCIDELHEFAIANEKFISKDLSRIFT